MTRNRLLGVVCCLLCCSFEAAAQAGRGGRGAQPAGSPTAPTGTRGGRSDTTGAAPTGALEFYNFDPTAGAAPALSESATAETHQKITVGGQTLAYITRAGYLPLRHATTGQSEAHLFYTAYTKDGETNPAARPLVVFLGGAPGVSSAWQDFGGLGPKRLQSSGAPAAWADNPATLLPAADLVFVNPVGAGYSRPDRPDRAAAFWNTAGETAALAEFVRAFVTRYERRSSPLFLAGEDLGTGRAASLASYLLDHQIPVQGVVLLSLTIGPDAQAGDAQYITLLPSLVMAAWHHQKLAPELNKMSSEQIAAQARQLAGREYLHALYKGDRMTADERAKAIADVARMTGLSKAFVANNNLRVSLDRFAAELLRDQQRSLSNSDARVTGYLPPPSGGGRGGRGGFGPVVPGVIDFNLSRLAPAFLPPYEEYLARELAFKGGVGPFYLLNGGVTGFTSTGSDEASLTGAFARNPRLRLFVGINYFDLNAPFYATEFTLAHLNVSPEARARNITVSHLEAGQMPYLDEKALGKLHRDLSAFLTAPPPAAN